MEFLSILNPDDGEQVWVKCDQVQVGDSQLVTISGDIDTINTEVTIMSRHQVLGSEGDHTVKQTGIQTKTLELAKD